MDLPKYWRCRIVKVRGLGWLEWLWPAFGHLIKINLDEAYCERCDWREPLPSSW